MYHLIHLLSILLLSHLVSSQAITLSSYPPLTDQQRTSLALKDTADTSMNQWNELAKSIRAVINPKPLPVLEISTAQSQLTSTYLGTAIFIAILLLFVIFIFASAVALPCCCKRWAKRSNHPSVISRVYAFILSLLFIVTITITMWTGLKSTTILTVGFTNIASSLSSVFTDTVNISQSTGKSVNVAFDDMKKGLNVTSSLMKSYFDNQVWSTANPASYPSQQLACSQQSRAIQTSLSNITSSADLFQSNLALLQINASTIQTKASRIVTLLSQMNSANSIPGQTITLKTQYVVANASTASDILTGIFSNTLNSIANASSFVDILRQDSIRDFNVLANNQDERYIKLVNSGFFEVTNISNYLQLFVQLSQQPSIQTEIVKAQKALNKSIDGTCF